MTLKVFQCTQCGHTLFPARYFCPSCGGGQWRGCVVERGTVAESTVVRHRVGAHVDGDVHLASVVTSAGPIVIARLTHVMRSGDAVSLDVDDAGCVTGRAF
ncbi:zinc ribbon domain-containing protein [Paraburkholderia guartelaensis]|uniref:zinc ribbon domain-containing protein n=1 Tax=Paraburkholderia guartelaensis TaxID=2546446 RepID=UPI002AB71169|nr:zinc ribbon domain-containing protein [Paraburkholderia guartelaensis]